MDFEIVKKEYLFIRQSIFKNKLKNFKHELIHILFRVYLNLINYLFEKTDKNKNLKAVYNELLYISKWKIDFQTNGKYFEIILKVFKIFDNYIKYNCQKKIEKEFIENINYRNPIIISKYPFEVFLVFLEQNNLSYFQNLILFDEEFSINLNDNNYKNMKFDNGNFNQNNKKNLKYNNLLLEDDFIFYSNFFNLENKNFLKLEDSKLKINFKNIEYYFKLGKNIYDTTEKDNVLKILVNDLNDKISYYRISDDFSFIILGYYIGKIKVFILKDENNIINNEQSSDYFVLGKDISTKNFKFQNNQIKVVTLIGHQSTITSIKISYNNDYFLSSDSNGVIRIWKLGYNECVKKFNFHVKTIWDIDISNRGNYFLSCSEDNVGAFWNINLNKPINIFNLYESIPITCNISFNLLYAIFGCFNNNIFIYDLNNFEMVIYLNLSKSLSFIKIPKFLNNMLIIDECILIIYFFETETNIKIDTNTKIINAEYNLEENLLYIFSSYLIIIYEINNLKYTKIKEFKLDKELKYGNITNNNLPVVIANN